MQRIIIVYNPRASKQDKIEQEVMAPARKMAGVQVGKYAVKAVSVNENAEFLARILFDGDLVVAAGGDGTAAVAENGALLSGKKVRLAVLPYGNFNDVARCGTVKKFRQIGKKMRKRGRRVRPLEILIDGQHWRWAIGYFSVGMFAESTAIFDMPEIRGKLCDKDGGVLSSIRNLARWYFGFLKEERRELLPECSLNGVRMSGTDYMAVNGRRVARVMRGGKNYLTKEFVSVRGDFGSFLALAKFMARSILVRVPGAKRKNDVLEFSEPTEVMVQAEGEYAKMRVRRIEVRKTGEIEIL